MFENIFLVLLFINCSRSNYLDGNVYDYYIEKPLENVIVSINGTKRYTDIKGQFKMKVKVNKIFNLCLIILTFT